MKSICNALMNMTGWRGRSLDCIIGGCAVLGLAPFYIWPIAILSFAYVCTRLLSTQDLPKPTQAGFSRGFWFAFGYFGFGLYWIGSAFIERGGAYVWMMPFAIALLCAGLALFWGFAGWVLTQFSSRFGRLAWLWAAICLFTTEWVRGHVFGGFPWNLPGYIFEAGMPISQSAHYIGIYGLSFLSLLLAASLGQAIAKFQYRPISIFVCIFIGLYGYGYARLSKAEITFVPNVKLRLVHANIAQRDRLDPNKYVEIANTYLSLSAAPGLESVTHVIWPEGVLPGLMFENKNLLTAIGSALGSGAEVKPIFIGQSLRAETSANKTRYYNSAAFVTFEDGLEPKVSSFYDKQKLVPFGEFMPGGAWVERLGFESLSSAMVSMTPGTSGIVPELPSLPPVSIQICYEILFPRFTQKILEPSGGRPEWILNVSNDSWYGNSLGPRQQANQARYRAIETGLPVIRATSGGITAAIDPYGRNIQSLSLGAHQPLDVKLPKSIKKFP